MQSKQIDELSKEELIKIVKRYRKIKYGLIWEDKPETVADRCVSELPVLVEAADLEITNNSQDNSPVNLLIEGDNYHALFALTFTHKNRIDFIYIDPPYNTGKAKEWKYNDRYIDVNDPYKHSKWISFIYKRLRLARVLLKQSGVMFVSIDDHELPRLTEMCEKIFGEQHVIACLPTIMNFKGNQAQYGFAGTHEYTLVVAKNKLYATFHEFEEPNYKLKEWVEDDIGIYKKGAPLQATGTESTRETRPQMFYPILVSNTDDSVSSITDSEYRRIYNKEFKSFDDEYLKILISKYEGLDYSVVLPMAGASVSSSIDCRIKAFQFCS